MLASFNATRLFNQGKAIGVNSRKNSIWVSER
jgi:hypothetical protein